jgi:hypothetical protein
VVFNRKGLGVCAFAVAATILLFAANAFAIPFDPNGGYIWTDDSLGFNIAQGQVVFDNTGNSPLSGSLQSLNGAAASGWVSSATATYPGPYTFALVINIPIISDISSGGTADGIFGGMGLTYSLIDLENSNAVLLSGQLLGTFSLLENFNNQLQTYDGEGPYGGIRMTVTGGSLQSHFSPEAEMYFQYWISSPTNMQNFSTDLTAGGGGSVTIYGVPEPATLFVLIGGTAAVLARRRVSRK